MLITMVKQRLVRLTTLIVLTVLGIHGSTSDSNDEYSTDDCVVTERFRSPYVRASFDRQVVIMGCLSREQTNEKHEEIYAVNLKHHLPARLNDAVHLPVVNLFIKSGPHARGSYDGRRAIYLLSSVEPVKWKVRSDRSGHAFIGHFWISNQSSVSAVDRRSRLSVRNILLPSADASSSLLVDWIRQKWGALTSLLEVNGPANRITVQRGIDSDADKVCNTDTIMSRPMGHSASLIMSQETSGCVVYPVGDELPDREVHVIEVWNTSIITTASTSDDVISTDTSSLPVEVALNVHSLRLAVKRHIVLILKSHQQIRWRITTRAVRGDLDVITDHVVNSKGVLVDKFRVAAEQLHGYSGEELMSWTAEKYGIPLSYTSVVLANVLEFIVDGIPATDAGRGEMTTRSIQRILRTHEPSSSADNIKPTAAVKVSEQLGELRLVDNRESRVIGKIKMAAIRAMSISCVNYSVQVSIEKSAMRPHGVLYDTDLTLIDVSCRAQDNGSHFILSTRASDCGTSLQSHGFGSSTLFNTILVHDHSDGKVVVKEEEDFESIDGSNSVPISIKFSCDQEDVETQHLIQNKAEAEAVPVLLPASSPPEVRLKVYRDSAFKLEFAAFPADVSALDHVYVEVHLVTSSGGTPGERGNESTGMSGTDEVGESLRVMTRSCWLVAWNRQQSTSDDNSFSLFANGCHMDGSAVRWIEDLNDDRLTSSSSTASSRAERFSFRWRPDCRTSSILGQLVDLRCDVMICSDTHNNNDRTAVYPACTVRDQQCVDDTEENLASSRDEHLTTVARGPLVFASSCPDTVPLWKLKPHVSFPVVSPAVTSFPSLGEPHEPCKQTVHVLGLQSELVIGVAFASFIIGVALMASIWFIYVKTAPSVSANKRSTGGTCTVGGGCVGGGRTVGGGGEVDVRRAGEERQFLDSSGESTPCSTAPITAARNIVQTR